MAIKEIFSMNFLRNKRENQIGRGVLHTHTEYEVYYMKNGETSYLIDNEIFNVKKGDFVFIQKGIPHMTDYRKNSDHERILINFSSSIIDEFFSEIIEELANTKLVHISETHIPTLEQLLFKIESEFKKEQRAKNTELNICIMELLTLMYRYKCERKMTVNESDKICYDILEYINNNYYTDIGLGNISKIFAISEAYLSRKFKSVLGIGINQYITYIRINNAKKLLLETDLSITEIAEKSGFDGSNYFAAVFKKSEGIPPSVYRKRNKI